MFDLLEVLNLGGNLVSFISNNLEAVVSTAVIWIVDLLISFLPASPFLALFASGHGLPAESIRWLNWFVDVNGMAAMFGVWLTCVFLYMVLHEILKIITEIPEAMPLLGGSIIDWITGIVGG